MRRSNETEVSDGILDLLERAGVSYIFGITGTSTLPLLDRMAIRGKPQYISVRHEQIAVHMADGVGRGGGLGVVLVTRGSGAANTLVGMLSAFASDTPLLLLVGQGPTPNLARDDYQVVDLVSVFRPVTKWAIEVTSPDTALEYLARAIRIARAYRPGPVMVSFPTDTLEALTPVSPRAQDLAPPRLPVASDQDLCDAATLLCSARRPVILAGNGVVVSQASAELEALGRTLGAPIIPSSYRRDVAASECPQFLWEDSYVRGADLILSVGPSRNEFTALTWNKVGTNVPVVQIDADPSFVGKVRQATISLIASPKQALAALSEIIELDTSGSVDRVQRTKQIKRLHDELGDRQWPQEGWDEVPIRPWVLIRAIRTALPDSGLVCHDSGALSTTWMPYCFQTRVPGTVHMCLGGVMGLGFPGALGLKVAQPDRSVISLVGDGSLLMTISGLTTMATLPVPITVVINNNSAFLQIKRRQKPPYLGSGLVNPDFIELFSSFGIKAVRVTRPDELEPALRDALAANKNGEPQGLEVVTTNDVRYATPDLFFEESLK